MKKVVLVTGSTQGIGKAIAYEFAKNNFSVILNSSKSERVGKLLVKEWSKESLDCYYIGADISKEAECKKLFDEIVVNFGRLDVLVNNAGIFIPQEKMSEKDRVKMFQIKLQGIQFCSDLAIEKRVQNIINISSVYAIKPNFSSKLSSALQAGVVNLTHNYAKEFAGRVSINAVAPGYTNTPMVTKQLSKKYMGSITDKIPIKRLITPQEIARVVYFLSQNPIITGQTILADGGYSLI